MPVTGAMKRPSSEALVAFVSKKGRNDELSAVHSTDSSVQSTVSRTSSLMSPIMLLSGHKSEVNCVKFHPNGNTLISSGFDRDIFMWNTYGECDNYGVLSGHKGAVLDLHFSSEGDYILSASTDKSIMIWDSHTGARIKKLTAHQSIVNCCHPSRRSQLLCSGGDDCTVRLWDQRKRGLVSYFKDNYQITAITFNDSSDQIIFSGIENVLKVYDLRKNDILYTMAGHFDTVTGLALSPDGNYVLSNSMDNSLCIWDIRPFAPQDRCIKTLTAHQHNFEKNLLRCSWSPDGTKVTAGSADRFVYIWDATYKRVLYKLPGHLGSVNEVVFHPSEPIVLSGSSDKNLYLGEIEA